MSFEQEFAKNNTGTPFYHVAKYWYELGQASVGSTEPHPRNCNENCPGNQAMEGVSDARLLPKGCICESDTTRCPYDEAEEDRVNRQAARELLNCGEY